MNRQQRRAQAARLGRQATALRGRSSSHLADPDALVAWSQQLFRLGRSRDALAALAEGHARRPDHVPLHTTLAYALAATGDVAQAITHYRALLRAQPDSPMLLANLAALLARAGQADEALALLQRAAAAAPEHANTAYTLAELLGRRGRQAEAFHHFRRAAVLWSRQIGPQPRIEHCDDLVKLATAQLWTGDLDAAIAALDQAVALRPDHALALARRGLAFARLGRKSLSLDSFRRAAVVEPGLWQVRRAIGELLLDTGRVEAAQGHLQAARRRNPGDAVTDYLLAAATQVSNPDAPPDGMIEALFDEYAGHFEAHLQGVLQYRAPELMMEILQRELRPLQGRWQVVDLGCGTGLCGPLLRPLAQRLVGVDLSQGMLDRARAKGVYDELWQTDLVEALGRLHGQVDLAASADVMIYVGSLSPVLRQAAAALKPGGWFVFTTEVHEGEGYVLSHTGRYLHARGYVESEARGAGFEVHCVEAIVSRFNDGLPVMQDVHVLRRPD